ncbi:hypothetical protein IC762_27700 [Bradyrhizobium genosp. L]|uniref:hypothetical protein n=1 Tax=Bradyrhizobium genosp. L TaxID=83637 RepID=UPI0018A2D52C|nr:hypothetical protein [Bradyrhizobium genosp. L]QPF83462.1 hypothetical protein IC762_27700 [Bradyrhizobium genosp. L]
MVKLVQIQIHQTDYRTLKSGNYNLCFAQKTNGAYTVLCQSISNYLPSTHFSWQPDYQLFGTNFFTAGAAVVVETNAVAVDLVRMSVAAIDAAGVVEPAAGGAAVSFIPFSNANGPIHVGLIGSSAGPDDTQQSLPIHVGPQAAGIGLALLAPLDMVRVWFQQNIATSTMLSAEMLASGPNAIEVDLTASDKASLHYESGMWSIIDA